MSIRDEIKLRTEEQPPRLFFLAPLMRGMPVRREMFVSEEIYRIVHPPWEATELGARHARMRAYLDAWTEGRLVSLANDPYKKSKSTFMARIDPTPDGVLDIRCIAPRPGIRVFGCFADADLFVALTVASRDELKSRRNWRDARESCKATWRRLFPTYDPFSRENLNEYVSNNLHIA